MVLVIDNFDSFTFNLVQYLGELGVEVVVRRNNELDLAAIKSLDPDGILLSPGPCSPRESGVCRDVSESALAGDFAARGVPVFGVCLGHQTIGDLSGGTVRRAKMMMHGKSSLIEHDGLGLFTGLPNPFRAIRYHSLVVEESDLPADLLVTARSLDDGEIQGLRHRSLPIEGVQFHPESILTEGGRTIISNFVAMCRV
jgi:anthranilate synthase/aminodeoxychorismate synthase-like glutamine amidotransferase